jgi:hypothetical protein
LFVILNSYLNDKVSKKSVISSGRGGYRPGAGRPKGSGNKLTVDRLLASIDTAMGQPLEEVIANNYIKAQADPKLSFQYEQLFLNKVMADRQQIEIDDTSSVESRQDAFLKALETIGAVAQQQDTEDNSPD